MWFDISDISIPPFEGYTRNPRDKGLLQIDIKNIIAEILGWEYGAWNEVQKSFKWSEIPLEWEYAIILRYKREKDKKTYPAIVMGFDIKKDTNSIVIRHIQGTKEKRIAYRFASGFDYVWYLVKLIQENFTEKWIYVYLPNVPINLESASYWAQSIKMYDALRIKLETLNARINS